MKDLYNLLPNYLEVAIQAAQQGGLILKKFWGNLKEINEKSCPGDMVTEADRQSEAVVLGVIKKHFPEHQILAEESGLSHQQSDFVWAIDPLDGTTNYIHQYPMFAVSIGLLFQQKPILGVIYNPITEEIFTGAKGLGAKLNQTRIQVSKTAHLKDSLLATGFAYNRREVADNNYKQFCHMTGLTQGVRRAGAASLDLAYVACGRLDGYWELGLKPWDIVAGAIIVMEAGGQVTDYHLNDLDYYSGRILASNGVLQKEMSIQL